MLFDNYSSCTHFHVSMQLRGSHVHRGVLIVFTAQKTHDRGAHTYSGMTN